MTLPPDRVATWGTEGLPVDPWTVLRLARYRRRADVPGPVWAAAEAMAGRASALARPVARLRLLGVGGIEERRATLADGTAFTGVAVSRHLRGAASAVAFALTLGPALEAEVTALGARDEPLDAYLLDLAGWAALEGAVRWLRQDLRGAFPGRQLSHRLGPGHRDWPLEEQAGLLALLGGDAPPVHLSPHGVLVPFKSISGLFAIRPAPAP